MVRNLVYWSFELKTLRANQCFESTDEEFVDEAIKKRKVKDRLESEIYYHIFTCRQVKEKDCKWDMVKSSLEIWRKMLMGLKLSEEKISIQ